MSNIPRSVEDLPTKGPCATGVRCLCRAFDAHNKTGIPVPGCHWPGIWLYASASRRQLSWLVFGAHHTLRWMVSLHQKEKISGFLPLVFRSRNVVQLTCVNGSPCGNKRRVSLSLIHNCRQWNRCLIPNPSGAVLHRQQKWRGSNWKCNASLHTWSLFVKSKNAWHGRYGHSSMS